jgi:hypothetical protein
VGVNWGALLGVAVASAAVAVTLVALVACAVVGLSAPRGRGTARTGTAVGVVCVLGAATIVGFGLAVIAG